ncbi:MAG: hypothetical protein WDN04_22110 [Rhodospirillales bacterium]
MRASKGGVDLNLFVVDDRMSNLRTVMIDTAEKGIQRNAVVGALTRQIILTGPAPGGRGQRRIRRQPHRPAARRRRHPPRQSPPRTMAPCRAEAVSWSDRGKAP